MKYLQTNHAIISTDCKNVCWAQTVKGENICHISQSPSCRSGNRLAKKMHFSLQESAQILSLLSFERFPEISGKIFSMLDIVSLFRCRLVSSAWARNIRTFVLVMTRLILYSISTNLLSQCKRTWWIKSAHPRNFLLGCQSLSSGFVWF